MLCRFRRRPRLSQHTAQQLQHRGIYFPKFSLRIPLPATTSAARIRRATVPRAALSQAIMLASLMHGHNPRALLLLVVSAVAAVGQTGTSMPSNDEILELMSKAEEKVGGFEKAVKGVKPDLDKVDPQLSTNYLDSASAACTIIVTIRKNGPSAYALVGLVTTLDDMTLDAATATVQLLLLGINSGRTGAAKLGVFLVPLMTSKNECNDMSELIMHATSRYIQTEEDVLEKPSHVK